MNYFKCSQVFTIFLFIIWSCGFGIAGEWKRVSERCTRGCDEEKATPRVRSDMSTESSVAQPIIVITDTPTEAEVASQPQWQIPVFKHERRSARKKHRDYPTSSSIVPEPPSGATNVRTGEYYPPAAGGVIDPKTGTFYQDVGGGYVNSRTGEFSPKIGGK